MKLPFSDDSVDAIFSIEALCHAPDKKALYTEIFRVLKPGGCIAVYDWCMTDKYDPKNPKHNEIKKNIELGDGVPNLETSPVILEAIRNVGFEILEEQDLGVATAMNPVPWYQPLMPGFSLNGAICKHFLVGSTPIRFPSVQRGCVLHALPCQVAGGDWSGTSGIFEDSRDADHGQERLHRRWTDRHLHPNVLHLGQEAREAEMR